MPARKPLKCQGDCIEILICPNFAYSQRAKALAHYMEAPSGLKSPVRRRRVELVEMTFMP